MYIIIVYVYIYMYTYIHSQPFVRPLVAVATPIWGRCLAFFSSHDASPRWHEPTAFATWDSLLKKMVNNS